MPATVERADLAELDVVARAMCETAEHASELGSLKSFIAGEGIDPDLATGCARVLAEHVAESLPRDEKVELSQLVVIGMCVGLRLKSTEGAP